jgi:hypothetical protein
MIQTPDVVQALGPLAGPAWVMALSAAVVTGVKVGLMLKHQGTSNGNGKHAHIDGRDLLQITTTINGGFRDLRLELQGEIQRVANAQESLAAYAMGVIKTLEAERVILETERRRKAAE